MKKFILSVLIVSAAALSHAAEEAVDFTLRSDQAINIKLRSMFRAFNIVKITMFKGQR